MVAPLLSYNLFLFFSYLNYNCYTSSDNKNKTEFLYLDHGTFNLVIRV